MKAEFDARVAAAPLFAYDPPSADLLLNLARSYHEISGELIRTRSQRNLLAAGHRMHGPDLVPFLQAEHAARGSTMNLLGIVRCSPRRDHESANGDSPAPPAETEARVISVLEYEPACHDGPPCSVHVCLAALIYCADHRPTFDPTATRRYDRSAPHPSTRPPKVPAAAPGTSGAGARW